MRGVVRSLLAAVSLLAVVGLRYPLKMLPLLLFELVWKSIWIVAIDLPLWSSDGLDPATRETWNACLMGLVLFPLVILWRHVLSTYLSVPADRWGRQSPQTRTRYSKTPDNCFAHASRSGRPTVRHPLPLTGFLGSRYPTAFP